MPRNRVLFGTRRRLRVFSVLMDVAQASARMAPRTAAARYAMRGSDLPRLSDFSFLSNCILLLTPILR